MFDNIFAAIEKWMRELLTGMVESNMSTMFTDVNEKTSEIAAQVGRTPQNWNSSVFSMIQNLSESVVVPIAGIIITLVLCYELISMLTERNNLHDVDTWMFFKYFVKAWVAIYLVSNCMKSLGVEKNPDPLPGSLDILQCRNGIDTIVEDYKTVPGWDNPYIQNHVVQPLQGALAVQDVELAYEIPDAYFHIQTCEDGFDYTLYNKDFTERDGGVLETDGDKSVQEAMTELLAEFGCDAAQGRIMDAAELREQADTAAEQQAEVLKEKLAAERPAPEETLSFYVVECLEFTFAGEFHDHLTMEEALEAYDKIPSERMNADKCIGFCIEEDGGFVGMYELVVNDKVQRENINSINYFRDDKLVQQAISDMEKLMAARQQSKEQERGSTKKSVLDALRSLKAKKQEQPAQEQDKPKKAKKKGMEL